MASELRPAVEITQADRELFVKLMGYNSETNDVILAGNSFTWEVEQIAHHRLAERAAIVAWLRLQAAIAQTKAELEVRRENERGARDYFAWKIAANQTADAIEAGEHLK